jgi:hypothetical protein
MDAYLERLQRELKDAIGDAGEDCLVQAPAGKWNAVQILEHLILSYKQTQKGLVRCLEQNAPTGSRRTWKDRFATLMVVDFGYIPGGRKAPERTTPRGMAIEEARQGIAQELQRMASRLDECERVFGGGTAIMDHPFIGPLTAQQWRKFHWAHGRHHARQIRQRINRL